MYRPLLGLLFLAIATALPAHAQLGSTDPLSITLSNPNPRPYQTITAMPTSDLIDLAAAKITMTVNGKVVETGGVQKVPVTVGGPGELTTIAVTATVAGQTERTQIAFRPADVALVVEPVSTTHPFYRGAGLVPSQGRLRVIALPDLRTSPTSRLASSNLIYTWRWGDQLLAEQSGIGRSILTATAPVRYRDATLTVTVTNADQTLVAEASTLIAPVAPLARIYPTDPLQGVDFDHAVTGPFTLAGEEAAFHGVAYFFGGEPSLTWSVNSAPASSDKEVTVRTTGTGQGTASLMLTALLSATEQSATSRVPVTFGTEHTNIFGF
jgi:hypothetical protein